MLSLDLSRLLLYGVVFLVVSFIVDALSQPKYPPEIPILGFKGWFSKVRNSFAYFTKHQSWIDQGYQKVSPPLSPLLIITDMSSMGRMALLLLPPRQSLVLQTSSFQDLKSHG